MFLKLSERTHPAKLELHLSIAVSVNHHTKILS